MKVDSYFIRQIGAAALRFDQVELAVLEVAEPTEEMQIQVGIELGQLSVMWRRLWLAV